MGNLIKMNGGRNGDDLEVVTDLLRTAMVALVSIQDAYGDRNAEDDITTTAREALDTIMDTLRQHKLEMGVENED